MSSRLMRALSRGFSSVLVTTLLMLSVAVPPLAAAGTEEIVVPDVTLQDDETVTINVRLNNADGLGGATMWLEFDPTLVEATAASAGNIAGGSYTGPTIVPDDGEGNGEVRCSWNASGAGATGNFIFFSRDGTFVCKVIRGVQPNQLVIDAFRLDSQPGRDALQNCQKGKPM